MFEQKNWYSYTWFAIATLDIGISCIDIDMGLNTAA